MARLSENSYGKGEVRLTKVVRSATVHELYEFNVQIILGGAFDRVYTHSDNTPCIPTDTMKNTVYALGKKHSFTSPEGYGKILTAHFIEKFAHVAWARAAIKQTLWTRIPVAGKPHDHAFVKAGGLRTAVVKRDRGGAISIAGGITGLEVLKTTNSAFTNFLRDEYTTLKDASDRIFATSVTAEWEYTSPDADFNAAYEGATKAILDVFATHVSEGVQATIFVMGEKVLETVPAIAKVSFEMPNQHRIPMNLEPLGMKNDNDIFVATSEPFGLIRGTITRD